MVRDKTLDQQRAAYAWKCTEEADADFKALVSGAPALIMQNGLMQALAYYQEKRSKNGASASGRLADAIVKRLGETVLRGKNDFGSVMQALHEGDSDLYLRATEEALETLRWLRQLAKARVKG